MRIGFGYDIHPLKKGEELVLGGEKVPFDYGLCGHSDADVLIHAVIDALLGAAGCRDIGYYFPDNDDFYRNYSSLKLLHKSIQIVEDYKIGNIDLTVIAERPKLNSYAPAMKKNIAGVLNIDVSRIAIKFTTNEGIGSIGSGDAIAACAVALILSCSKNRGD